MAKIAAKRYGTSKIRFVLLEADLGDGDLGQITQAIQNALRPVPQQHRLFAPTLTANGGGSEIPEGSSAEAEAVVNGEQDDHEPEAVVRTPRARKFQTPKVIADLDLNGGDKPFASFAEEKGPKKDLQRHLLVAYWCREYRGILAVTADHAYTCYRKMGWGTSIKDFAQPFRDLQRGGRGAMKDNAFTINQIGEDVITKMGSK